MIVGVISVTILFILSERTNHSPNGFIRLFPPHPVLPKDVIDIKYNSYYIAGATSENLYLGNFVAPRHMLVLNKLERDTQHVKLEIKDFEKLKLKRLIVTVDSPDFFITDGISPAILKGALNRRIAEKYMYDSIYFTEIVPITKSSFAVRSISSKTHEYALGKVSRDTPHVKIQTNLLTKQIDGIFCTDGMLHYNSYTNSLIYLYHYRNQFICLDTNLNILYSGKTIDTISHAKIKVAMIKSEGAMTMGAPPLTVNKQSCVWKNYLFVHSNLLANNENRKRFDQASTIDVYDLATGNYKFSFYLFDHDNKKMSSFKVFNGMLFAIYDHYLLTYDLTTRYFN